MKQSHFDNLGITASSLCIVHCLGSVLLLFLLPIGVLSFFANESVHHALALGVFIFGLLAFSSGYRVHGNSCVILLAIAGMSGIAASQFTPIEQWAEIIEPGLTFFGSALLITAHWQNRKLCLACQKKKLISY